MSGMLEDLDDQIKREKAQAQAKKAAEAEQKARQAAEAAAEAQKDKSGLI